MPKNNNHKKLFHMDGFGRRFYCQRARLGMVRGEKKQAKKKARQELKSLPTEEFNLEDYMNQKNDYDKCTLEFMGDVEDSVSDAL